MAVDINAEIARLTTDLEIVETAIKRIAQNGQSFRKGGSMGFAAEQAKLSDLRKERDQLRAKLALWGVYDV